jgi:hypothetical protein
MFKSPVSGVDAFVLPRLLGEMMVVTVLVALGLVVSSCAGTPTQRAFISVTPNSADFLQWTQANSALVGQEHIFVAVQPYENRADIPRDTSAMPPFRKWYKPVDGAPIGQVEVDYLLSNNRISPPLREMPSDRSFTGTINGNNVVLTFSSPGASNIENGTINGSTLTLVRSDGGAQLAQDVYHEGSMNDYNRIVSGYQQAVAEMTAACNNSQLPGC